ncbi:hypothetical protein G6F68_020131 [Rhizopus microsporus]|nr:hypothetical protein G6F68_020131 [Rhizopus microsporus]
MLVDAAQQRLARGEVVQQATAGQLGLGRHRLEGHRTHAVTIDHVDGGVEDAVALAGSHRIILRDRPRPRGCRLGRAAGAR